MRLALLALLLVAACAAEEDQPRMLFGTMDGGGLSVTGTKFFEPASIAAVKPSAAILARAEGWCPQARFVSAISAADDPRRVSYFFLCP
jgi:hypothetical protein